MRRVARPGRWAIVGSVAEAKDYLNRKGAFTGAAEPHLIVLDLKPPAATVVSFSITSNAIRHYLIFPW